MLYSIYDIVFTNEYVNIKYLKIGLKKVNMINALNMNNVVLNDYKIVHDLTFKHIDSAKNILDYLGISKFNNGKYSNEYLVTALKQYGKIAHISLVNKIVVFKDSI